MRLRWAAFLAWVDEQEKDLLLLCFTNHITRQTNPFIPKVFSAAALRLDSESSSDSSSTDFTNFRVRAFGFLGSAGFALAFFLGGIIVTTDIAAITGSQYENITSMAWIQVDSEIQMKSDIDVQQSLSIKCMST